MENFSPLPFVGDCNATYTTTGGQSIKTSVPALLKIMESIPEKPKILTMEIEIIKHKILPPNTIFISKDIADALEQALTETKPEGGEK